MLELVAFPTSRHLLIAVAVTGCITLLAGALFVAHVARKQPRPSRNPHGRHSRRRLSSGGGGEKDVVISEVLVKVINNILVTDTAGPWAESLGLPLFKEQLDHLLDEFRRARPPPGRTLILDGPPGIGKGMALKAWVAEEGAARPAIYMSVTQCLAKGNEDKGIKFRESVQRSLGWDDDGKKLSSVVPLSVESRKGEKGN